MKKVNKDKALILFCSFLVVSFLTLFILTLYEKYSAKELVILKKKVSTNGVVLNKTNYYVPLNSEVTLDIYNPNNAEYKINILDKEVISLEDGKLMARKIGYSDFSIEINNFNAYSGRIYVINGIRLPDQEFDKSKQYVACNEFSEEENKLLDEALKDRVNSAGESTRAGVVAAARFLTLEFDRRIAYFYENGRLNNYEGKHVDGEGRYYHKGLYLNPKKYDEIEASFTGPATWGCKITQYEDEPGYGYYPGDKKPNGFDCSGFISWVLYNGGFDVKDTGAGDIAYRKDDLYDLGEQRWLNQSLLDSGVVKVGDLIAYPGHMALIAGIGTDGHYYVVESLPNFRGVVLNNYTQPGLIATFTHVMLMDSVYKNDGNLTNMWY